MPDNEIEIERAAVFSPDDPAPDPKEEKVTDSFQGAEEGKDGQEAAAEPDKAAEPEKPATKPKDAIAKLTGRIGHLTRLQNEAAAALAAKDAELETLRGMLPQPDGSTPKPPQPTDIEARAAQIADQRLFDAECNKVFEAGMGEYGTEFQQAIVNLNSMQLANRPLIEAAIEAGQPAAILKFLGEDLDEAERIAKLPPAKMGVALAKLAGTLERADNHSKAPAPIKPIGGATKAEPDIYDPEISMDEYVARRKKTSGDRDWWLQ